MPRAKPYPPTLPAERNALSIARQMFQVSRRPWLVIRKGESFFALSEREWANRRRKRPDKVEGAEILYKITSDGAVYRAEYLTDGGEPTFTKVEDCHVS